MHAFCLWHHTKVELSSCCSITTKPKIFTLRPFTLSVWVTCSKAICICSWWLYRKANYNDVLRRFWKFPHVSFEIIRDHLSQINSGLRINTNCSLCLGPDCPCNLKDFLPHKVWGGLSGVRFWREILKTAFWPQIISLSTRADHLKCHQIPLWGWRILSFYILFFYQNAFLFTLV